MKTRIALFFLCALFALLRPTEAADGRKPVLLYSRYFNAKGETRYLPDGSYKDVLEKLRESFEVRVSDQPLKADSLNGVAVVLIANPSDQAVGDQPKPHHCTPEDVAELNRFVRAGGGIIAMGNQENHNLETADFNTLLAAFGMKYEPLHTDAKKLVLPATLPIIGGLRWAYYTGNSIAITPNHEARARVLVANDLAQKPIAGTRDEPGALLAIAEPGKGHVVVITDAGWLSNDALSGKGIGGVAITEQDNLEIFLRLANWAAAGRP